MKKMMNLLVLSSMLMVGQAMGGGAIFIQPTCPANSTTQYQMYGISHCKCNPGFLPNASNTGCDYYTNCSTRWNNTVYDTDNEWQCRACDGFWQKRGSAPFYCYVKPQ